MKLQKVGEVVFGPEDEALNGVTIVIEGQDLVIIPMWRMTFLDFQKGTRFMGEWSATVNSCEPIRAGRSCTSSRVLKEAVKGDCPGPQCAPPYYEDDVFRMPLEGPSISKLIDLLGEAQSKHALTVALAEGEAIRGRREPSKDWTEVRPEDCGEC